MVALGKRVGQIVTGAPSHFPFVPAEPNATIEVRATHLLAARAYGEHAVVVANLLREGTSANAAADRKYTQQMFGMMAEGVPGPIHIGDTQASITVPVLDRL